MKPSSTLFGEFLATYHLREQLPMHQKKEQELLDAGFQVLLAIPGAVRYISHGRILQDNLVQDERHGSYWETDNLGPAPSTGEEE